MNIANIKKRATEVLTNCQPQLIRIFVIIMLIKLFETLLSIVFEGTLFGILPFIVTLLFITVEHGYIVSSLKAVRNRSQYLSDDDALVGFKRYKDLFFTYFLIAVIIFGVVFAIVIVSTIVLMPFIGMTMSNLPSIIAGTSFLNGDTSSLMLIINYIPELLIFVVLIFIVLIVAIIILSIYLFPVPYLLEQYHMSGTKAISEGFSLMKGHCLELFKLMLSFVGWMILAALIQGVLSALLSFIPVLGDLIAIAISGIFAIYAYSIQYSLSQAIFFEELAYYRYGSQQSRPVAEEVQGVDEEHDKTI